MSFGERLVELRMEMGFASRSDFAKFIGIPSTTLRNYETNVREPGHAFLKQIAGVFHVSIDYLLCVTDDKTPYTIYERGILKKYQSLEPRSKEIVDFILG